MKTTTFFSTLIALALMGTANLYAQYGLGTNAPNAQAALHIESTSHGVLIPNVALTNAGTFLGGVVATADHESMLVYNTSTSTANGLTGEGFYYWADGLGGSWVRLQSGSAGSITPATIDPGADGQVLTTTGTTVGWATPAASTMSHWNVQGGTTAATSNTDNIYQDGNVAIGTATNPRNFQFNGALFGTFREHNTATNIVWTANDFHVMLTGDAKNIPALELPDPTTAGVGRIVSISNSTGSNIAYKASVITDESKLPNAGQNGLGWLYTTTGQMFLNTGTEWVPIGAR